jgi:quinol monooxygenase YgiN
LSILRLAGPFVFFARDPRLFYIYSRWKDEAALDPHTQLPNTVRFVERAQPLIDHPLELTRTWLPA